MAELNMRKVAVWRYLWRPERRGDTVDEVAVHHGVVVVVDVDPADPYVQLEEVVNVDGDNTTMQWSKPSPASTPMYFICIPP